MNSLNLKISLSSLATEPFPSHLPEISLLIFEDPIMRQFAYFKGLLLFKTYPTKFQCLHTDNKS